METKDSKHLIFERVGKIVYARYFGDPPLSRWVYKELEE
jgi:hypothetical protein